MSVRRVMGTEVEYGISVPGQPTANPTTLSSQVVNAWAVAEAPTPRRPRWDFEEESPLRDARGFDLSPAQALDHTDLDEDSGMADIIRGLVPFFVTRQVFAGSGRVGIGTEGRTHGFQLSQRADFFEVEVGLETTLKRPIINTRDEPHADADKYRRLHVIIGDANLAELSTYLKVGTTSLVLAMIEARALSRDLALEEPVEALQAISHDPSLSHRVRLRDGRQMTAIEIQRLYLEQA